MITCIQKQINLEEILQKLKQKKYGSIKESMKT